MRSKERGQLITEEPKPILTGPREDSPVPGRVLILSAEMGEGHNAAAEAITAVIHELWPGCQVERFDTLELWGHSFARAASAGYRIQMQALPMTYEVFYDALCRSDRFAAVAKAAIGRFFGRRLERFLAARNDDLVISTYPFGSAALHWLRAKGKLRVPTVTYVPAFHVHPVWVYPGIDQHYVMYDTAPEHARTAGFERTMRIGAPPIKDGFGSLGKAEARTRLGYGDHEFIVLVTGGAWGLGGVMESVTALTGLDVDVKVVAVCGRSAQLAERLRELRAPVERLHVLGYVDNMHELMAAADVVVTNGAGVTVLEALCTPRPVIAFRPLAGHGKASTAEMVRRDLALPALDVPELVSVVRRLATDRVLLARMEHAGRAWAQGRDLRASVRGFQDLFDARRAPVA